MSAVLGQGHVLSHLGFWHLIRGLGGSKCLSVCSALVTSVPASVHQLMSLRLRTVALSACTTENVTSLQAFLECLFGTRTLGYSRWERNSVTDLGLSPWEPQARDPQGSEFPERGWGCAWSQILMTGLAWSLAEGRERARQSGSRFIQFWNPLYKIIKRTYTLIWKRNIYLG